MTTSEIATVLAWHDALNSADIDTLAALSSDDIEIGDAHGAAQGHEALRNWAASHRVTTQLGQLYVHDGVVVAEQKPGGPDGTGGATTALAFRVVRDHVTSVFRHDSLASALASTELTESDAIE